MYEFMYFVQLYISAIYVKGVRNLLKEARGGFTPNGEIPCAPSNFDSISKSARLASKQANALAHNGKFIGKLIGIAPHPVCVELHLSECNHGGFEARNCAWCTCVLVID